MYAPKNSDEKELELELDLTRFVSFYFGLPDGRSGLGARVDQVNNTLVRALGHPPTRGRDGVSDYWIAPKGTIEEWVRKTNTGASIRPIYRPFKVFHACYVEWGEDLTKDQCFANRFEVHDGAEDLLEVGRATIERLPPGSKHPFLIRIEKVCLTPKTKRLKDKHGKCFASASLGFFNLSIVANLPNGVDPQKTHVLVEFLSSSEPASQSGKAIGTTVRWHYPDLEWQMIKPHSEHVNSGQLLNASLVEFTAEVGERVNLSVVVSKEDFSPIVRLDTPSESEADDEKLKARERSKLIQQILKKRLDNKGRHALASGTMVVE